MSGVEGAGLAFAFLPLLNKEIPSNPEGLSYVVEHPTLIAREHFRRGIGNAADHDNDISKFINDPCGSMWEDTLIQKKLSKKLGRDYAVFMRAMTELAGLLKELSSKLGLSPSAHSKLDWSNMSAVDREMKKFRDIFSKSVYANLLSKIDNANSVLRTSGCESRCFPWCWIEIEAEPVPLKPQVHATTMSAPQINSAARERRVEFAMVMSPLDTVPWPQVQDLPPAPASPIQDICSALCAINTKCQRREPLGFITDRLDTMQQHIIYVVKSLSKNLETESLEELLGNSPRLGALLTGNRGFLLLSRQLVKATLEERDILFAKEDGETRNSVDHPYLCSDVFGDTESAHGALPQLKGTASSLIRNDIVFPLGLALVELSLCETISAPRRPEDEDPGNEVADLKTATRVLREVYYESGRTYGEVVDKCLNWSTPREAQLEDDELFSNMFEYIVLPLLEELGKFEGQSSHF
ncbi:hypothetical protein AJ79_05806 [Helicocarpus griseus UAMH5409]|uniref:DUF7580 domain-containing protein n=1 Tax=Helicocarpus griseus UAMH5409 TaxID=1447875 RepID=A0A2B7XJP5_9EURO|nr:hypothetical protein AJ79_05806 [Helicocarpus griseus UAMH5409]